MLRNFSSAKSSSQLDKTMSEAQFNQIVEAILSGKYSWACLLILRFSGYNPLHYIPYRTYNRLMKANQGPKSQLVQDADPPQSNKFKDLGYLEEIDHPSKKVKGGKSFESFPIMTNLMWSRLNLPSFNRGQKIY